MDETCGHCGKQFKKGELRINPTGRLIKQPSEGRDLHLTCHEYIYTSHEYEGD